MNPAPTQPLDPATLEAIAREIDPPAWKIYDLEDPQGAACPAWLSNVIAPSLRLSEAVLVGRSHAQLPGMVARYSEAVRSHPDGPLTRRQEVEVKNLAYWTRRAFSA